MSAKIASDIGLSYNPNIVLNMQSANGTMDRSLGLVRNVPCTIGDVMVYLQIHVLQSPAYDILLGCPFDVLTRSTVNTISDVETTITITDPNTGQRRTIPTFPRSKTKSNTYLYATASNISDLSLPPHSYLISTDTSNPSILGQTLPFDTCVMDTTPTYVNIPFPAQYVANEPPKRKGVQVKKKYKPVVMKTKLVASHVSEDFRIKRQSIGNPLATIPLLNPNPPPFVPTKQFTSERQAKFVSDHDTGFLTSDEINVLVDMVAKQEKAFAWEDSERGSLHPDFFPPVRIPTIPHVPWVQHNRPIPPGLEKEVCKIIRDKISAGVYKPSNSAYRLQWFCILKKNSKFRIVHSLEPLNRVTIRHSGVPPFSDHVAKSFAGRICGATLDLYFFELLNRILQRMKYCGGTFSSHKLVLCAPTFKILAVDTSYIAVGYYLCQCTSDNRKERHYNRFGSIMLNDREARFSQPKLELYGLYRALQALRMYLIGVRNLIIEVDARYIKGMLQNPNIQPSASMNRWIMAILMFHFELVHVKGTFHGPDGLSQHPPQPDDTPVDDSDNSVYEDWIDRLHGFIHQVQLPLPLLCHLSTAALERPHFNVCQALFKAVDGDQSKWSTVLNARRLAAICFEKDHAAMICNYNFKTGDLVLMRNTRIEVTHNKKMKPYYLGPLVVISRNRGGAYILCELDGSVLHRPVAAFCLIPYLAREHITVPSDAFDINTLRL
ncbi:hypothetical protein J132_10441 [Termitomyces sp. J132]|nr:hypothetical protein J132_10441 [Termitomyces sp. J132]